MPPAMARSPLSPVLVDAQPQHASSLSDCGSSECSTPSTGSSPNLGPRLSSEAVPPGFTLAVAGSPHAPSLAVPPTPLCAAAADPNPGPGDGRRGVAPTSPARPPPRRGLGPAAPRPLCLDFLNGKCLRQRADCRYYHPHPEELTLASDPSRPICEVWALTGFCKYGRRCWKQHLPLAAQLPGPIDKPITHKFQQWLQSHSQKPSSPALLPGGTSVPGPSGDRSSAVTAVNPRCALSERAPRTGSRAPDVLQHALQRLRSPSVDPGNPSPQYEARPGPSASPPPRRGDGSGGFPTAASQPALRATTEPPFVHQPYAL